MDNISIKEITRKEYREFHIQSAPLPGETPEQFINKIIKVIKDNHAQIVRATFFGDPDQEDRTLNHLKKEFREISFPISWIEGNNCDAAFINGAYLFAISGTDIKRIQKDGSVIGSYFQTPEAEFCFLGGLCSDPGLSPAQQTEDILYSTEKILNQQGLAFENTVRTWFYLDDILDWYCVFNLERSKFYSSHGVLNKCIPASTGIGGKNPSGSKICLELNAIKAKNDHFKIETVTSPMQCSALDYGSSFSRAVMYHDRSFVNMTISGTAGIDQYGKTAYPNRINEQMELSVRVISEIIDSRGFTFNDITRVYAYFRDEKFSKGFQEFFKRSVSDNISCICSVNAICRDDLLFEIEMDLAKRL